MVSKFTSDHHHVIRTQLFLILGTAFFLISFVYCLTILYTQKLMKDDAISSTQTTLSLYMENIDTQLQQTSSFLSSYVLSHDFSNLSSSSEKVVQDAKLEICRDFQTYIKSYNNTDALFFFDADHDTFLLYSLSRESYSFRQKISDHFQEVLSCKSSSPVPVFQYWVPIAIDDEMVLYEIIQYQNFFVGSWRYLPYL